MRRPSLAPGQEYGPIWSNDRFQFGVGQLGGHGQPVASVSRTGGFHAIFINEFV